MKHESRIDFFIPLIWNSGRYSPLFTAVLFQVLLPRLCSQWCVHVRSGGSSAGRSPRQRGTPLLPVPQGK